MNQPKSICNIYICKCTSQIALITSERPTEKLALIDISFC